ncbi:MAG TPA: sigma-70 family RNA polymerase sigma factor [Puia sp.]|jgi:RNA polymerase sigma-70 factor (ECF subfamily)
MSGKREIHHQFNAFCKGSEAAFSYFFNLYNTRIYYFVLRRVKDAAVAGSLTEQAFMTVFASYRQIETFDHLLACLYYFARKCADRHLVGNPCTEEIGQLGIPPPEDILGIFEDAEIAKNESQEAIQAEIRALSPQRRKVMELKHYHGLDVRAIALELNIVKQTVRNHLSWSKNHLRNKFGDNLELLFP